MHMFQLTCYFIRFSECVWEGELQDQIDTKSPYPFVKDNCWVYSLYIWRTPCKSGFLQVSVLWLEIKHFDSSSPSCRLRKEVPLTLFLLKSTRIEAQAASELKVCELIFFSSFICISFNVLRSLRHMRRLCTLRYYKVRCLASMALNVLGQSQSCSRRIILAPENMKKCCKSWTLYHTVGLVGKQGLPSFLHFIFSLLVAFTAMKMCNIKRHDITLGTNYIMTGRAPQS